MPPPLQIFQLQYSRSVYNDSLFHQQSLNDSQNCSLRVKAQRRMITSISSCNLQHTRLSPTVLNILRAGYNAAGKFPAPTPWIASILKHPLGLIPILSNSWTSYRQSESIDGPVEVHNNDPKRYPLQLFSCIRTYRVSWFPPEPVNTVQITPHGTANAANLDFRSVLGNKTWIFVPPNYVTPVSRSMTDTETGNDDCICVCWRDTDLVRGMDLLSSRHAQAILNGDSDHSRWCQD